MYDTLHLRLHDPCVMAQALESVVRVAGANHTAGAVLFHDVNGMPVYATRVRYNGGHIQITSANGYCYLNVSLPRVKSNSGSNLIPVTKAEFPVMVQRLQDKLYEIGIVTSLREARVCRFDLFANAATRYTFQDFKPLFDTLYIPRRFRVVYAGSYTFRNTQREDQIYDKRAQMEDTGVDTTNVPAQCLRFETRLLLSASVRTLGVHTVDDLERRWDVIEAWFVEHIKTVLRYSDDLPQTVELGDVAAIVDHPQQAKTALFARAVLAQVGGFDELRHLLKQRRCHRKKIQRFVDKVVDGLLFPLADDRISLNELKRELCTLLLESLGVGGGR